MTERPKHLRAITTGYIFLCIVVALILAHLWRGT